MDRTQCVIWISMGGLEIFGSHDGQKQKEAAISGGNFATSSALISPKLAE